MFKISISIFLTFPENKTLYRGDVFLTLSEEGGRERGREKAYRALAERVPPLFLEYYYWDYGTLDSVSVSDLGWLSIQNSTASKSLF